MDNVKSVVPQEGVPQTEEQVDQLLASIEGQPQQDVAPGPTEEQPKEPEQPMHTIKWGGQEKSLPLDQIIKFAQQGYDYNEKMADLKYQQNLLEQQKQQLTPTNQSQANQPNANQPEQTQNLSEAIAHQQANPTDPGALADLNAKVEQMMQFMQAKQEEEQQRKIAQQDALLDAEIMQYKSKYPHFDWNTVDSQSNQTLEQRIMDYAVQRKISDFEAAANSYLLDEHLKRKELEAKESFGKELQEVNHKGLGPVTDAPTQIPRTQVSESVDVSNKSWDQLGQEALLELGAIQ